MTCHCNMSALFKLQVPFGSERDFTHSGSRKKSVYEDDPARLSSSSNLESPKSETFAIKFSSRRTLLVLKCMCRKGGTKLWRYSSPDPKYSCDHINRRLCTLYT